MRNTILLLVLSLVAVTCHFNKEVQNDSSEVTFLEDQTDPDTPAIPEIPDPNWDPSAGWHQIPITYHIQKPYDKSLPERYLYDEKTNIHYFRVLKHDKPHMPSSHTHPRTEMAIEQNWISGDHQYESYFLIPAGRQGFSLFQIFGGNSHITSLMLHIHNGNLTYYMSPKVLLRNIWNKWIKLNVIHSAERDQFEVYVNNVLVLQGPDDGKAIRGFKCGTYQTDDATEMTEIYIRNIRLFTR